ncbi:MAG: MarR family winged helix-turn-helix transcriptional regulator [Solirubrobacteraceae bacterium]
MTPSDGDLERLLRLRAGLRRFLHWSEEQARAAAITPSQHQLLLAVRGHPDQAGPSVGELADCLSLRHHSTVELIDRAAAAGLVLRHHDSSNRSIVRVELTERGANKLNSLSATHLRELRRLAPTMVEMWTSLQCDGDGASRANDGAHTAPVAARHAAQAASTETERTPGRVRSHSDSSSGGTGRLRK